MLRKAGVRSNAHSYRNSFYGVTPCGVFDVCEPRPNLRPAVGIDLGIAKPIVMSTGQVIHLPRTGEKERHKLATLQRKIARKTKGSRNQAKARVTAARF